MLLAVTAVLTVVFAWLVGIQNPFKRGLDFYLTYHFAGGIELGSPVRLSGIKVGKVEKIEFFLPTELKGLPGTNPGDSIAIKEPGSAAFDSDNAVIPIRLKISVNQDAAYGVRKDSRFYINLAGIIGERYIEISPGHKSSPQVQAGETLAGVDPPRIDQLLSQSFDLAGKIADFVEENKGDITHSIELLYKLSDNLNHTLAWVDKSAIFKTDLAKLIDNLIAITSDLRKLTAKTQTQDGKKTLELLYRLLWRLEPLESETIRSFFQKEGIKVHFF